MKRILYLIVCPLLIVQSCINTLDWSKESGLEKQLIMNSYIYTDESVHTIYMALSDGFYLRELPQKAEIECFINGVPVCKADSMEYYHSYKNLAFHKYFIKAKINPGDIVELRAKCGDLMATAKAEAAPACDFQIDTVSRPSNHIFSSFYHSQLRDYTVKLTLMDRQGESDYYRLFHSSGQSYATYCGEKVCEIENTRLVPILFDENDPIFKISVVDFPTDIEAATGVPLNAVNSFNIFPDQPFADGKYPFKYNVEAALFCPERPDWNIKYDHLVCYANFRAGTMTKECYDIFNSLNLFWSVSDNPFTEPIILKNNVTGGLGTFCIVTVTNKRIEFAPIAISDH